MKTWFSRLVVLGGLLVTLVSPAATQPAVSEGAVALARMWPTLTAEQQSTLVQLRLRPDQVLALNRLYDQLGAGFFQAGRSHDWDPVLDDRVMRVLDPAQQDVIFRLHLRPEQTRGLTALAGAGAPGANRSAVVAPQVAANGVLGAQLPVRRLPAGGVQPVAPGAEPGGFNSAEPLMNMVRGVVALARQDRLGELVPSRAEVTRTMRSVVPSADLLNNSEGLGLANEFFRQVRLSPEQAARLKSFRLSKDQGLQLMELVLDRAPEWMERGGTRQDWLAQLAPEVASILTPEQMSALAQLDLSPEQMRSLQDLVTTRALPLLSRMSSQLDRSRSALSGLPLGPQQTEWVNVLLDLLNDR